MAQTFKFELVSPERLLVSAEVESVMAPASEGDMTVMANHAPVMTAVRPGVVSVRTAAGREDRYVVFGGFADVTPTSFTLLAEQATPVADIDRAALSRRIQDAREDLADASGDERRQQAGERLDQLLILEKAVG
ncbi:MAG: F0F1 ATP synthase subunit epsilon [Rhizobiaceae bacterium]